MTNVDNKTVSIIINLKCITNICMIKVKNVKLEFKLILIFMQVYILVLLFKRNVPINSLIEMHPVV